MKFELSEQTNASGPGIAGRRPPALPRSDDPAHQSAGAVAAWFDHAVADTDAVFDDTLHAARQAAATYQRHAKAANTRLAYRAAIQAWCSWCDRHGLCSLPAAGPDVAAFLAAERGRGLAPNTLDLRRAAIRYLHRLAGCPVPTDDACVSETLSGIRREAAGLGQSPHKKKAATAVVVRRLLTAVPDDLRGRRDRALILALPG
jgi:site-specific recombinase XerC